MACRTWMETHILVTHHQSWWLHAEYRQLPCMSFLCLTPIQLTCSEFGAMTFAMVANSGDTCLSSLAMRLHPLLIISPLSRVCQCLQGFSRKAAVIVCVLPCVLSVLDQFIRCTVCCDGCDGVLTQLVAFEQLGACPTAMSECLVWLGW